MNFKKRFMSINIKTIFLTILIIILMSKNSVVYATDVNITIESNVNSNSELENTNIIDRIMKYNFSLLLKKDEIDNEKIISNTIEENHFQIDIENNNDEINLDISDQFEEKRNIIMDIYTPSGLSADEYDKLIEYTLKSNNNYENSKFIGLGKYLYQSEQDNQNINGLFILSIITEESGWGHSYSANKLNNLGGIMRNQNGFYSLRYFDTPGDCINYMGNLLSKHYINKGLSSIVSIGRKYCPPTYNTWANSVEIILNTYYSNIEIIINE